MRLVIMLLALLLVTTVVQAELALSYTCVVGLSAALVARYFYKSHAFAECVKYFRAIWAYHARKKAHLTAGLPAREPSAKD